MSDNIDRHIHFVNQQAEYQLSRARHYESNGDFLRHSDYESRYTHFVELAEFLESKKPPPSSSLHILPDDLVGLPPELIDALNISSSDKKDFLIIDVLKDLGGIAIIDKIMIGIYRRSGEIENRNKLMARLYRMSVKGLIYAHPIKKGIYSLEKIEINSNEIDEEEENDE